MAAGDRVEEYRIPHFCGNHFGNTLPPFRGRLMSNRRHRYLLAALLLISLGPVSATSNHEYGADEYVTIARGISPNGKYAITAHGQGDLGDENFHLYLTDAQSGKRIGPLEEVVDTLYTGADAFAAKWSADSEEVTIIYRVDRHAPLKAISYHIAGRRARKVKGPFDVQGDELATYWHAHSSEASPSPKVFGTPLAQPNG